MNNFNFKIRSIDFGAQSELIDSISSTVRRRAYLSLVLLGADPFEALEFSKKSKGFIGTAEATGLPEPVVKAAFDLARSVLVSQQYGILIHGEYRGGVNPEYPQIKDLPQVWARGVMTKSGQILIPNVSTFPAYWRPSAGAATCRGTWRRDARIMASAPTHYSTKAEWEYLLTISTDLGAFPLNQNSHVFDSQRPVKQEIWVRYPGEAEKDQGRLDVFKDGKCVWQSGGYTNRYSSKGEAQGHLENQNFDHFD